MCQRKLFDSESPFDNRTQVVGEQTTWGNSVECFSQSIVKWLTLVETNHGWMDGGIGVFAGLSNKRQNTHTFHSGHSYYVYAWVPGVLFPDVHAIYILRSIHVFHTSYRGSV